MTKNAAIIGAGMAGLTTAAYLARAGLKVDVYEQHTLPGGYISSLGKYCRRKTCYEPDDSQIRKETRD